MMLRVIVSLGIVLGLCWGATWALKRRGGGGLGFRSADQLQVVERRALSKGAAVAIVRVSGEDYLIGVTDHNVALLHHAGTGDAAADRLADHSDSEATVDLTDDAVRTVVRTSGPSPVRAAFQGTRWTGSQKPSVATDGPTRMGFVEALREMTVRRS
jgi:flagellar biosynthetic protein FliO